MVKIDSTTLTLQRIVAINLRERRLRLGLSQEEFAEQSGFHRTYIGSVERGERNITLSTLQSLAQVLQVAPTELLTEQKDV